MSFLKWVPAVMGLFVMAVSGLAPWGRGCECGCVDIRGDVRGEDVQMWSECIVVGIYMYALMTRKLVLYVHAHMHIHIRAHTHTHLWEHLLENGLIAVVYHTVEILELGILGAWK